MSALNMIFLRLVISLKEYIKKQSEVPFEQWMRRVAVNYIIDEFRKQKRYREMITLYDETPSDIASHDEAEGAYDKEELMHAISLLPPVSRTVFNLFAVDGYKHEEIAVLLGITAGTSKSHLFKARRKLREILESVKKKANLNDEGRAYKSGGILEGS